MVLPLGILHPTKIREEVKAILRVFLEELNNLQEVLPLHPDGVFIPKRDYFLYRIRKLIFDIFN
jgi:hypothetical protein